MVRRTKYKRYQFVLEWVTLGIAALWIIAALVLLNWFCDQETEVFKRNMLLISIVVDIFAYVGFSSMSVLPAGNSLLKTRKYNEGTRQYQSKKESILRDFGLISKIVFTVISAALGLFNYFI